MACLNYLEQHNDKPIESPNKEQDEQSPANELALADVSFAGFTSDADLVDCFLARTLEGGLLVSHLTLSGNCKSLLTQVTPLDKMKASTLNNMTTHMTSTKISHEGDEILTSMEEHQP